MEKKSNTLSVICIILIIVVLGALKKIESKIDSVEEKVADQGKKITTLYDYADSEIHFEKQLEKKQEDTSLSLKVIREFKSSQLGSHAKFNPQNNTFAVLLVDGSIDIYNIENSDPVSKFRVPDKHVTAFCYLPDGKKLLIGTKSGSLYSGDLLTNKITFIKQVSQVKISRLDAGENNRAAVGLGYSFEESKEKKNVFILDILTGNVLSEYSVFLKLDYQDVSISNDGNKIALKDVHGKKRNAYLFDASNGTESKNFHLDRYSCLSVCLSPDTSMVAAGLAPYHTVVWDSNNANVKWLFEGHTNWVVSLDFSDDMKYLASGAGDSTARVYDLQAGKEIGRVRFKGTSSYVDSVDISADGKYILAAVSKFVGIYEMPK